MQLATALATAAPLFTPFGIKAVQDMLTSPAMMKGGKNSLVDTMYDIYKTHVLPAQKGGARRRADAPSTPAGVELSDKGVRQVRVLLTSKRVLRGGASLSDTFLRIVSPRGFDLVREATGGGARKPAPAKKLSRKRGGADATTATALRAQLPVSESINSLPASTASTQTMEMLKLDRLITDANSMSRLVESTRDYAAWVPDVIRSTSSSGRVF